MINLILKINIFLLCFISVIGCNTKNKNIKSNITTTEKLLNNIKEVTKKGILFGHHDAPVYGIGWEGDNERSDIKSVCGAYPAVMSFDLGHLELGNERNLDNVLFSDIRKYIVEQYERGGLISLSWHVNNPKTNGDSWDVTDKDVVTSVLEGGVNHELMLTWLDNIAEFMNSLRTKENQPIPVLFRPWHEHTGSWFWWGQDLCTTEEYKSLWKMTYDRLKEKSVENVIYTYSSGMEPNNVDEYLERYPGNEIIDLLGVDIYQFSNDDYIKHLEKSLMILTEVGKTYDKAIALTETGFETIPDSVWWTNTLLPIIEKYPLSYVLVWRNAREKENHYYAPYPGQVSCNDFIQFYNSPKTLFIGDKFELYN